MVILYMLLLKWAYWIQIQYASEKVIIFWMYAINKLKMKLLKNRLFSKISKIANV